MKSNKNLRSILNLLAEESKEDTPTEEELIDWFRENPNPGDADLHKWAEGNDWNVHKVESMVYKIVTDHIKMHIDKEDEED